jgi:hypothetical protein
LAGDALAHEEDLLLRPYKLQEDPCHDRTIGPMGIRRLAGKQQREAIFSGFDYG